MAVNYTFYFAIFLNYNSKLMDNRPFLYFLTKGDQLVVCVIQCPKVSMFYFTKNEQFISALTTTLTVLLSQWECYYQGKDGRTSSDLSCPNMIPKNVIFLDGS